MDPRSLTNEFKEFLKCLNAREVDYLVIGGHAVAFHGYPRTTNDLDVWVAVNALNASRLQAALSDFGFAGTELPPELFLKPNQVIRMGLPPNRIEIQTGIDGVQFSNCSPRAVTTDLEGLKLRFIALEDLKKNKRASGRYKDLADLEELP